MILLLSVTDICSLSQFVITFEIFDMFCISICTGFDLDWCLSPLEEIVDVLSKSGLNGELCLTRQAGRERLSILRFSKS